MKVALVHDWLTGLRGGERCLIAFLKLYPQADIFTLIHVPGATTPEIDARVVKTSWLNNFPYVEKYYRVLLPLFPFATAGFDFKSYDLVISLSHAVAKNIKVPKEVKHISYCFTPMRYIWDQTEFYLGKFKYLAAPLIALLRRWDLEGSKSVDHFVAISRFVEARIRCFYGRSAKVIYPPVNISWLGSTHKKEKFFLYAGALVPYKRPDLVIKAFNKLGQPLIVIGKGSELKKLKRMANDNIQFIGSVPDRLLSHYYKISRALIFPGIEDFGMVPVESLASGTPVIGLSDAGGVAETINGFKHWQPSEKKVSECCGVFIENKADKELALIEAVQYFLFSEAKFSPAKCIEQAKKFEFTRFYAEWQAFCQEIGIDSGVPYEDNLAQVVHA